MVAETIAMVIITLMKGKLVSHVSPYHTAGSAVLPPNGLTNLDRLYFSMLNLSFFT